MGEIVRTYGSVKPTSECCGTRIVVGNARNLKLTALRERSDGGARISARNAGGYIDVGWRYEIDAECPECGDMLAWNLAGLREYLEGGERQGEKPPSHPAQEIDRQSPLEEMGEELARWMGYEFPANSSVRESLEHNLPEGEPVDNWWLDPSGEPIQKPDVTGREFAEEVLEELRAASNIASVSVTERDSEWGASIEIEDDEPEPRKPRLEKGPFRMKSEGATGTSFPDIVLQIALMAADAGVFPPSEGVEYQISRAGAKLAE